MLAILAVLSDIPAYLFTFIGDLTGQDMSPAIDAFSRSFGKMIESFESMFKK